MRTPRGPHFNECRQQLHENEPMLGENSAAHQTELKLARCWPKGTHRPPKSRNEKAQREQPPLRESCRRHRVPHVRARVRGCASSCLNRCSHSPQQRTLRPSGQVDVHVSSAAAHSALSPAWLRARVVYYAVLVHVKKCQSKKWVSIGAIS